MSSENQFANRSANNESRPSVATVKSSAQNLCAPDLIYDVGMHNGDDTAFYLAQGFRVIAIEADPSLAENGKVRFRDAIHLGRLTILNVGISDENASKEFWICKTNTAWNSFDRSIATRNGAVHEAIAVQTARFEEILAEFGVPYYLKIDIEGNDSLCLRALRHAVRPRFVSAEDCGLDMNTGRPIIPSLLQDLGYSRFKLVSQYDFWPLFDRRFTMLERAINSAAYGKLRLPLAWKIAKRMMYGTRLARLNHYDGFVQGSSGPWGDGLPGRWVDFEEACDRYSRLYETHKGHKYEFWCDWHAMLSG